MQKLILACSAAWLPLMLAACGPSYTLPGHPYMTLLNSSSNLPDVKYTVNGTAYHANFTATNGTLTVNLAEGDQVCVQATALNQHVSFTTQKFQQTPSDYSVFFEKTTWRIERAKTTFTVESGLCP